MSNHTDTPAKAESIRSIRERIARLAKSAPQDEDPLAEARAEQRAEQRACFVCGYGPHDPTPPHSYVAEYRPY